MLKLFRTIRLYIYIWIIFVSFFVVTIGIITIYFYYSSSKATLKIANDLISRTENNILAKLNKNFKPDNIIQLSNWLLQERKSKLKKHNNFFANLRSILNLNHNVHAVYLVDFDGNFFYVQRGIDSKQRCMLSDLRLIRKVQYTSISVIKHKNKITQIYLFYNKYGQQLARYHLNGSEISIKERPWYQGALEKNGDYWLGLYPFISTGKPGITSSFLIRDLNGNMLGIAAIDVTETLLKKLLNQFKPSKNSHIFIFSENALIISSDYNDKHKKVLAKPVYSAIQVAYKIYLKNKKESFRFLFNEINYITKFTHFSQLPGNSWDIGMMVPINHYVGIYKKTNYSLLLVFSLLLLTSFFLILLISQKISKPIVKLSKLIMHITNLEFDKSIYLKTRIKEIQLINESMTKLQNSLQSFSLYVPKALIKLLIKTNEIAKLNTQRKELTVLFSDIQGFSTIVEQENHQKFIEQMHEYFDCISTAIKDNKGLIDKFIGDAVMAYWGAPIDNDRHAYYACLAALSCKQKLNLLNDKWYKEGKPCFHTRFGINTGWMLIGNIGSSERLNYTVFGDNVNIAKRLQDLNKKYHTEIIISDAVQKRICNDFSTRPLGCVNVKGKQQTVLIHELVAKNFVA